MLSYQLREPAAHANLKKPVPFQRERVRVTSNGGVNKMGISAARNLKELGIAILLAASTGQAAVEGIPIDHKLTIEKCGGCHKTDENGLMGRVSFMRTTPEVWQQIIKRMMRLNGVVATTGEIREIVRYLSNNNGLAPDEMRPAFWEVEHRQPGHQFDMVPDESLQHTCNYCHNIGRVLTQRRTRDDYEKLISFHIGLYPGAENVFRPRRVRANSRETPARIDSGPNGGNPVLVSVGAAPVDMTAPYPIDLTLNYLAKAQPLVTPEWTAWKAVMRAPKLAGAWTISGYQAGKGKVYGVLTVEATAVEDEFATKLDLHYANSDVILTRTGRGIVYTGYSWRGRQTASGKPAESADPGNNPAEWKEAMMVSRDGNSMTGRWFWGGYDEFGFEVDLTRVGSQPVVLGTDLYALKSPGTSTLRIFGANLPTTLKPADIDLGAGITVKRVVKATPAVATVEVEVAKGLPVGLRDVAVLRSAAVKALAVYDKVAYIKVTPDAGMARLGGTIAPKQFMQFETIAYAAGDVALGPVNTRWSMEEFYSTPDDDDIKFVGALNDTGLFTPALEGPNPARKKQSNNYPTNNWGDVWINAVYDAGGGVTLKARSYLVVTIPEYVRYDQPEVSK
jgi:quinohemoprotein amine dehydrogenase